MGRLAVRSVPAAVIGTVVMALVAWGMFRLTRKRFEREEILTRWV